MVIRPKTKPKNNKSLPLIHPDAAGIDIGASSHFVAIPADRCEDSVQEFQCFTHDLHRLKNWLIEHHIKTVAMESTGIYWIPLFEILEEAGLDVKLINARHVSNVPGRKTDVLDCQWIQRLHSYGLLQGAFQPAKDMAPLRAYTRHRENWVRHAGTHIQHMQKALRLMNLNLDQVVSDITGATGMKIIHAIIKGERDPSSLARYRDVRCKKTDDEIARALDGHYREEHLFSLKQACDLYAFYQQQIRECDHKLEAYLESLNVNTSLELMEQVLPKVPKPRGNAPAFDLRTDLFHLTGVDLTSIDGINSHTALKVVSETGVDMSRWGNSKQFCSWLGLSPGSKISGGKNMSGKTKRTANRAAAALRISAQSLSNSKSALGAFYRKKRYHLGAAKAITATAHKLARIIYSLLTQGTTYEDPGENAYEEKYQQRIRQNLKQKAKKLGCILVSVETGEEITI